MNKLVVYFIFTALLTLWGQKVSSKELSYICRWPIMLMYMAKTFFICSNALSDRAVFHRNIHTHTQNKLDLSPNLSHTLTHTRPPQWGGRWHCGSCTSLWGCVQNRCSSLRLQRWCLTARWRCYCDSFSPQTPLALDIWSHVAPPPLTVSLTRTPERNDKLSNTQMDTLNERFVPTRCSYLLHGAVFIELPVEVEVLDADTAAVSAGQHYRTAIHCLQGGNLPYRHLKGLSTPHSWRGRIN